MVLIPVQYSKINYYYYFSVIIVPKSIYEYCGIFSAWVSMSPETRKMCLKMYEIVCNYIQNMYIDEKLLN